MNVVAEIWFLMYTNRTCKNIILRLNDHLNKKLRIKNSFCGADIWLRTSRQLQQELLLVGVVRVFKTTNTIRHS